MIRTAIIALALALATVAVACGGGGDNNGDPRTPAGTIDPNFTPQPVGLLTPQPPPPIDPEMELVEYVETRLVPSFAVGHPEGWVVEQQSSQVKFRFDTADRGTVAVHTVGCVRHATPDAARENVIGLLEGANAAWSEVALEPLQINGRNAINWRYRVNLGLGFSNLDIYFIQGTDCIWQLQGVVYALPPFDDYYRLFERMAESLREVPAASGD